MQQDVTELLRDLATEIVTWPLELQHHYQHRRPQDVAFPPRRIRRIERWAGHEPVTALAAERCLGCRAETDHATAHHYEAHRGQDASPILLPVCATCYERLTAGGRPARTLARLIDRRADKATAPRGGGL